MKRRQKSEHPEKGEYCPSPVSAGMLAFHQIRLRQKDDESAHHVIF
ncbi:hypothetical protein [Capillibacterium thermochitinicola]|nr:hypothetical protein [Capillibacterium thermochitinicola]